MSDPTNEQIFDKLDDLVEALGSFSAKTVDALVSAQQDALLAQQTKEQAHEKDSTGVRKILKNGWLTGISAILVFIMLTTFQKCIWDEMTTLRTDVRQVRNINKHYVQAESLIEILTANKKLYEETLQHLCKHPVLPQQKLIEILQKNNEYIERVMRILKDQKEIRLER